MAYRVHDMACIDLTYHCYLFICLQVIFRWWRITHRNAETQRLSPGEIKECHEDFLNDDRTQSKCKQGTSFK